jgi:hypothetical protein
MLFEAAGYVYEGVADDGAGQKVLGLVVAQVVNVVTLYLM